LHSGASESTAGQATIAQAQRSSAPTVSVILPTFNRLRFLRPALESVYAQTFTDWEVVIADDGSDPETRQYLRSQAIDPRVRVVWLPHSGNPAAVRNAALREARGEYVAFLDSDDVWLSAKLELQVSALRDSPETQWSYTQFNQIDSVGEPINIERTSRWQFYEGQVFEDLVTLKAGIPTPAVMVRRRLLEGLGGFDARQGLHEDYDLWLRLAMRHEVRVVKQLLVSLRDHNEHFSSHGCESFEARERVLRKIQPMVASRSQRAAVRAARARNAVSLAVANIAAGNRGAAVRTIADSWRVSWRCAIWWIGVAKVLAHIYLPARVKVIVRKYRRAARQAVSHG
jgi:glycosyltransferase involved in cell wall biosynthesis